MAIDPGTAMLGSAALGAAASFLGGGDQNNVKPRYGKQYRLAYEHQQKILSNQLQWRVKDAEKAGLHPLFALGGGMPSGSPSIIPGQNVQRTPGKTERVLQAASQGMAAYANVVSQAKLNESMSNYYDSLALKNQPGLDADKATANAVATGIGESPKNPIPDKVWVSDGKGGVWKQTNPDIAIGIEEVVGQLVDKGLNWVPNSNEFGEFVFGAWKRWGQRRFQDFKTFKRNIIERLPKKSGSTYKYGAM